MSVILIIVALAASLFAALFAVLGWVEARARGAAGLPPELIARLARLEAAADKAGPALREEIRSILEANDRSQEARFSGFRHEASESRRVQKEALDGVGLNIQALMESNEKRQETLRETLTANLDQLRKENEAKLEQMRLTVDEKLQGTLDQRLGESFKLVSDRLEQVHRGLGEMQTLATGVGDLKRVLTNVKSRGGWGEVQLGALLEDMLTPEQYEKNVRIRPHSAEVVEFAVRMPGKGSDGPVYLPIDAKFPHEDYDRLLAAQEAGLPEEIEKAGVALERAVRLQAKTICAKYVHPPHSTDCAIMYLPTEGLFAEVIRRPGLMSELQQQHRIMVTGPTTLGALLNSLQMGFRSIAIEKRSSEVWKVLGAAKAEFGNYSRVWEKLSKKLDEAKNTVDQAGVRTRQIERKLRDVEALDPAADAVEATAPLLALPGLDEEDEAA
jgi:DNA recombination protein RmuC